MKEMKEMKESNLLKGNDCIKNRIRILQLCLKNNEKYYLKNNDEKLKEKIKSDTLELEKYKDNYPEYFV